MEIKKFIDQFVELLDDTDPCLISAETRFKELEEWSSLLALSVIAMVDEEYEVTLKGKDIENATTIQNIFDLIVEKK